MKRLRQHLRYDDGGDGREYRLDRVEPVVTIAATSSIVDVDSAIGASMDNKPKPQQQQQHPSSPPQRQIETYCWGLIPKVRWHYEAIDNVASGFSGLYAMVLVCVYMAVLFTELVTFPDNQLFLEINGFFLYLYLLGVAFYAYVLIFVVRDGGSAIIDNHKSHGSLTIRVGALLFSCGTLCYFALETISFVEVRVESPCFHASLGCNVAAAIVFTILQTYVIFVYPRLNLGIHTAIDRFGLMHVVATNIILWIRTLMKESLHEIAESEEAAHGGHEVDEHDEVSINVKSQMHLKEKQLKSITLLRRCVRLTITETAVSWWTE